MGSVMEILLELQQGVETGDLVFVVFLVLSLFVLLYALNLVQRKIGLLENEMQDMRADQRVISQELELMAKVRSQNQPEPPPAA